jgi:hypothetical protein
MHFFYPKINFMKKILLLFAFTSIKIIVIAQFIPPPKFEFSGTKIRWSMQGKSDCPYHVLGVITDQDAVRQTVGQKIIDGQMYYMLNDGCASRGGTTLFCLDYRDGKILWTRRMNERTDDRKYSYAYPQTEISKISQDSLMLLGIAIIDTVFGPGGPTYSIGGFPNRRLIKSSTGQDISNVVNNDTWVIRKPGPAFPLINYGSSPFQQFSYRLYKYTDTIDYKTIITLNPFTYNEFMQPIIDPDSSKWFIIKEDYVYYAYPYGPVKIDENRYAYFCTINKIIGNLGSLDHYFWICDAQGNKTFQANLTDIVCSNSPYTFFDKIDYNQEKKIFRLSISNLKSLYRGYIYINEKAELILNQENLTLDNRPIQNIISADIKGEDAVLHIMRINGDKEISIYKETNGQFFKIGQLKQNDSYIYDYYLQFLELSENNDPIFSCNVLIDSSISGGKPLTLGGFNFICKIDAKELGLSTSLDEKNKTNKLFYFSPNPTSQSFYFHTPTHGQVEILDPSGRIVFRDKIVLEHNNIDISAFISGIYFIKFISFDGKIQVEKLIVNKL